MRTHIRVDSVKVFEDDAAYLEDLSKEYGIKSKTNVYRRALRFWHENRKLHMILQKQTEQMVNMTEKMEDLYFKIDTLNNKK